MDTKTINLRDLPEDFVRQAKSRAALSGMTLKDFVVKAVENAMRDEIRSTAFGSGVVQNKRRKNKS